MEKHPLHIKNPELQTSPEVQRAVEREQRHAGEKVPNDPAERIEAYMDRLENIFLNPDQRVRERNLEMFRDKIYDALIIKRENFPESYLELQKRIAREQGHGDVEISEEMRERMIETAIQDQKASLDAWVDYLTEEDTAYPAWFKFYVWSQVTKLSQFDKELGKFKSRTHSTVGRFPDINRAALAKILDVYQKVKDDYKNLQEPEIREMFSKKFPALYAETIAKGLAAKVENREETRGAWVKYEKNNSNAAERLYKSVEGKTGAAGWCVEGRETAKNYNEAGDFYVYYTYDDEGNPTQPRLAIQMNGDQIGQIRGLLVHQGVEPVMQEALDTALHKKRENDESFTKDDLVFLYEINSTIEGFGYQKDPRIAELRQGRNAEEDMLVIFECTREEIAHVPSQINEHAKAYVGQLEPGLFQKLPENLEHIYTSFPDKKIRRETIEIGGKSGEEFITEMEAAGIKISDYTKYMLRSREFVPSRREEATLIRLTVADLGFARSVTIDKIYERAEALGLELCPPDTGPHYRLNYRNQPLGEWIRIGMKQIAEPDGYPNVFELERSVDGLWLNYDWAKPDLEWNPDDEFVFRFRLRSPKQATADAVRK